MAIVFTAIIALLGIDEGNVYKSTSYGRSQVKTQKVQNYVMHNYTINIYKLVKNR